MKKILAFILLLFGSFVSGGEYLSSGANDCRGALWAQGTVVNSVVSRNTAPLTAALSLYADGTRYNLSGLYTANNTSGSNLYRDLFEYCGDLGFRLTIWRVAHRLQASLSSGLRYAKLSYKTESNIRDGVRAQWLNLGVELKYYLVMAGIRTDVFLHSSVRSSDNFSYLGFYPDCFSPADVNWYLGLFLDSDKMSFDVKLVYYIVPQIDPTKLAYYNMVSSSISSFYLEVGITRRLF